jgi:hypothetical protein
MRELDRLVALLEDAQTVVAVRCEDELRNLFATSRTDISNAFQGGVDGLLAQWDNQPNRIEMIRQYLLWHYIAYNAKEMYESYDLAREVLKDKLKKAKNG